MTSIAMKMKVGTAAGAIALAASLPAVMAPASAAPVPLPATPIQVLDLTETPMIAAGGLFDGVFGGDILAFLNNGHDSAGGVSTFNPVTIFFNFVRQVISFFCMKPYTHV
jgi:hypothetical protein